MVTSSHRGGAIAARLLLAILGGYVVAYAATAAFTLVLPLQRHDAVQAGAMFAFPVEVAATLWLLVDPRFTRPVIVLAALTLCCVVVILSGAR